MSRTPEEQQDMVEHIAECVREAKEHGFHVSICSQCHGECVGTVNRLCGACDPEVHLFKPEDYGVTPVCRATNPIDCGGCPEHSEAPPAKFTRSLEAAWTAVRAELPLNHLKVLTFSPAYGPGDSMRFRIVEGQFVNLMTEVTHWLPLESISPDNSEMEARAEDYYRDPWSPDD
jgi:hypothetical protein